MPRRGEIWWARLDSTVGSEISKTRPCVVVSNSLINQHRRTVVVVPLSSAPQAAPPILVPVECAGRSVVAVVDQVRALAKERLDRKIGEMSPEHLEAIEQGLRQVLDLH
jgi:mRNA interferase MazF